MFSVKRTDTALLLVFQVYEEPVSELKKTTDWILDELESSGSYLLKNKFLVSRDTKHSDRNGENNFSFQIAELFNLEDDFYFKLDKKIFRISFDVYIHKNCKIDEKWFITPRNFSLFEKINALGVSEPMIIGGNAKNAISEKDFRSVLKAFPNQTELKKYTESRIYLMLSKFFDLKKDYEQKYQKYLEKHESGIKANNLIDYKTVDIYRLKAFRQRLSAMLENLTTSEKDYQNEILNFIQVLYPKYVYVNANVHIKTIFGKNKFIDILLADYNGFIDIVEIKKPTFDLLKKNNYRNNYVPSSELEGAIQQSEKYIYHLMKNAKENEKKLNSKLSIKNGLELKIVNPNALIIMGRSNKLNKEQQEDFEIIQRRYKNIAEILSYDDLIKRIDITVKFLES